MVYELGTAMTIFGMGVTGVAFAVRQEARITTHDKMFELYERQANERHADLVTRLNRIEDSVKR